MLLFYGCKSPDQISGYLYVQWAVSLMITNGHFKSSTWICLGRYGLTYSLYHPQELQSDPNLGFTNLKCHKLVGDTVNISSLNSDKCQQ